MPAVEQQPARRAGARPSRPSRRSPRRAAGGAGADRAARRLRRLSGRRRARSSRSPPGWRARPTRPACPPSSRSWPPWSSHACRTSATATPTRSGYFQMRTSIWDQGEYKGYGEQAGAPAEVVPRPRAAREAEADRARRHRVPEGLEQVGRVDRRRRAAGRAVPRPLPGAPGRGAGAARQGAGRSAPPVGADADARRGARQAPSSMQLRRRRRPWRSRRSTSARPYQWGGATPETNFDCSGLMQWSYKQVGIDIPRVTYDQVNVGEHIAAVDDLEAGDMVFFQDASGDMHHVGMYIGEHKFIHAPAHRRRGQGLQPRRALLRRSSSPAAAGWSPRCPRPARPYRAWPPPRSGAAVQGVASPAAPQMPAPEPESGASGVFAAPAAAPAAGGAQTVGAMPVAQPQPAAAQAFVDAAVPSAPAAIPGAPIAPVAPEDMANTNEGGKLHASEFDVQDAEGAPGAEGNLHAGYDLFAKAGAPVRSPIEGTIVEVKASRGNSGQIFGGTVKVQGADGRVWVFRHVDPKDVVEGGKVTAGQEIASVTEWTGGTHHAHIELWKTLDGGYNVSNMDDPYVELQKAYAGGGTALPPDVHEHAGRGRARGPRGPRPRRRRRARGRRSRGDPVGRAGGPAREPQSRAARASPRRPRLGTRRSAARLGPDPAHEGAQDQPVGDHHRARPVQLVGLRLEPLRGPRARHRKRGRRDRAPQQHRLARAGRGPDRSAGADQADRDRDAVVDQRARLLHRRRAPGPHPHRLRRRGARGVRLAGHAPQPRRPRPLPLPRPRLRSHRPLPPRRRCRPPRSPPRSRAASSPRPRSPRPPTAATPSSSCRPSSPRRRSRWTPPPSRTSTRPSRWRPQRKPSWWPPSPAATRETTRRRSSWRRGWRPAPRRRASRRSCR